MSENDATKRDELADMLLGMGCRYWQGERGAERIYLTDEALGTLMGLPASFRGEAIDDAQAGIILRRAAQDVIYLDVTKRVWNSKSKSCSYLGDVADGARAALRARRGKRQSGV